MNSSQNRVLRSPEDVLAYVPTSLGFHPEQSVVLLAIGDSPFQARVDLAEDLLPHLASVLVSPVVRHSVRRVVLVYYCADHRLVSRAHRTLVAALRRSNVELVDAMEVAADRYRQVGSAHWRTYDVDVHPFLVEALVDGRPPLRSRAELALTLAPDRDRTAAVAAALQRRSGPVRTVRWAVAQLEAPDPLDVDDSAELLRCLRVLAIRDAVWEAHVASRAQEHVTFWRHVVAAAPEGYVVAPAALLSFAAWLSGDGALAWCALEIGERADPGYRMSRLMAEILTQALPPQTWRLPKAVGSGHGC